MTIDAWASLRRVKPERKRRHLHVRSVATLRAVADIEPARELAFIPDTNVYIYAAAGRLPPMVKAMFDQCLMFHSSVCIAELMVGIGNADPAHPRWPEIRDHYGALIDNIPSSRLLTPDAQTWADAGLIAGTLARTQRFQPHQRKDCLHDALILLTAAKAGLPVLTSNRDEFDLIQQLAPHGQFIHY